MAEDQKFEKKPTPPHKSDDVEIEPLSDDALEDVAGGICSVNVCAIS